MWCPGVCSWVEYQRIPRFVVVTGWWCWPQLLSTHALWSVLEGCAAGVCWLVFGALLGPEAAAVWLASFWIVLLQQVCCTVSGVVVAVGVVVWELHSGREHLCLQFFC